MQNPKAVLVKLNQISFMKRYYITLILFITVIFSHGQTPDLLFKEFEKEPKIEAFEVSALMMKLARLAMPKENAKYIKDIKSMNILNLEKCSESTKNKFVSQLSNAKFKDYQKIDTIKIDSTRAIVYIKQNKETISDIVFASLGPKLYNYIHLKGDLKLSELKHYLPKEDKKEKQN